MIHILKIGHAQFALRKDANVAAILKALTGAVEVRSCYGRDNVKYRQVHEPRGTVEVELVDPKQVGPARTDRDDYDQPILGGRPKQIGTAAATDGGRMTTLEIIFSVLCPVLLVGWICAYASGRLWRNLADFWHGQATGTAINAHRHHPLRDCIRRASAKHSTLGALGGRIRSRNDDIQDAIEDIQDDRAI